MEKKIKLNCSFCGLEVFKTTKEVARRKKDNPTYKPYCSSKCQHLSRRREETEILCEYCGKSFKTKETNRKFCSQSCGAKSNNRKTPKREMEGKCKNCQTKIKSKLTYCKECFIKKEIERGLVAEKKGKIIILKPGIASRTLEEETNTKGQGSNRFGNIRFHARNILKSHFPDKKCLVCKYDKHVECGNIKGISEINKVENLVWLCPNCHWEFDHGILKINGGSGKI